jgi:hypothetical protein
MAAISRVAGVSAAWIRVAAPTALPLMSTSALQCGTANWSVTRSTLVLATRLSSSGTALESGPRARWFAERQSSPTRGGMARLAACVGGVVGVARGRGVVRWLLRLAVRGVGEVRAVVAAAWPEWPENPRAATAECD